jgi:hypothetical protein
MTLGYVISVTIIKCLIFLNNFHKTEETLLSFSNVEKITAHRNRQKYEQRTQCVSGWEREKIIFRNGMESSAFRTQIRSITIRLY